MIIGIGTDLTSAKRIQKTYNIFGMKFVEKILHKIEVEAFLSLPEKKKINRLAKTFSVKESVGKALGTGIGDKFSWHDIILSHDHLGKPVLTSQNNLIKYVKQNLKINNHNFLVSLSDEEDMVSTFVIFQCLANS